MRAARKVKVKAEVTVPAGLKTFRFPKIAVSSPATVKQGDIAVILEGTEVDEQVWKVNLELAYPGEGPAFGVALLAQVGTGAFATVPEACDATIKTVDSTSVDPKAKDYYDRAYKIHRDLYQNLKGSFRDISRLVERGL